MRERCRVVAADLRPPLVNPAVIAIPTGKLFNPDTAGALLALAHFAATFTDRPCVFYMLKDLRGMLLPQGNIALDDG